jgi:16S rRNA (cytidine1402-2'-O)-methyltransferase
VTAIGTLYLVSTPIGNLADFTYRAVEVLNSCDAILAEDTRRSRILLDRYGIAPRAIKSLHKHNEAERTEAMQMLLAKGGSVALVSDSGTPLVSDPGLRLVRAAIAVDARVVPVPGPSAVLAALVVSGFAPEPFSFFGFPPRSGRARDELMSSLAELRHTAVLFESPQRLVATLGDLAAALGEGRSVAVARELTKLHEEVVRGTLNEVAAYYREQTPRGEVVLCIEGAVNGTTGEDVLEEATALADTMVGDGATSKQIVQALRERFGLDRNRAYAMALQAAEKERS